MDINHIKLPAAVVADLYTNTLVSAAADEQQGPGTPPKEERQPGPAQPENIPWKSLGSNQQHILIITDCPDAVYLTDEELSFLTGILGACKLSLADVAVVNLHHYPGASYKELTRFFKSRVVLLFDKEPASFGLPMSFPHYQLQAFAGSTFLYSPSLKQLENDKVEKSKLWVCLKRLFNL